MSVEIFCLQNCADLLQTRFLEFNDLKVETGSEPLLVKLDPPRQTVQLNLKKLLVILKIKKLAHKICQTLRYSSWF